METTDRKDRQQKFETQTSLNYWQKSVPYLFVGFILIFLYLTPEHVLPEGQIFVPRYLSFLTFICGVILAGALIGFCRQVPNMFLLCLAHIFAGHSLLQIQLVIWEFFEQPTPHLGNAEQLHFLILPLFMTSSLFLLALMERFEKIFKSRPYEHVIYGAYGSSVLIFSLFLHLTLGTPNISISTELVLTGSLISIALSFLALILFPLRPTNDLFSLRFWTVFLIFGNLAVYLTPTELLSGLTQLNSVEVEFVRSGVFLALIGGLIFHSVSIILTEQRRSDILRRQRAITDLALHGSILINKTDSFESAAKALLTIIAEREKYVVSHLILTTDDKVSHYWHMDDPQKFTKFREQSETLGIGYGEGFIGKLWQEQNSGNIADLSLTDEVEYRRKYTAVNAGLKSVYAAPVFAGSRLIAMMEFFKTTPSQPDNFVYSTINSLCHQLANLYRRQLKDHKVTERENLHQEVADRFPLPIAIYNKSEELVFSNSQFDKLMLECCEDTKYQNDFTDMVTASAFGQKLKLATDHPQQWIETAITCFSSPGNRMIWHLTSGLQLEFSCKRMVGDRILCLWSDVTAEQELAGQNQKIFNSLNSIFNTLPCGICIFDRDLKVSEFNSKFVAMLGLSETDIQTGISFSAFLKLFKDQQYQYTEFLSEMALLRIRMAEGGDAYHNGQMLFCQKFFNLYAAPTEEEGFTLTLMDMSDIESYQIELREAKQRAEGSAEKAMELARSAQSSNKFKTDFLTLVDREFRIPLNSISTATELLREASVSQEQSLHLKIIKSAAEDLTNLMEDIQDLANIEAHNLTLTPQLVHLGNFIDKLNTQWSFLAKTKALDFRIDASDNTPEAFLLDGRRLEQIVGNLVDNALKFTRSGEVLVKIKANQKTNRLNISVSDTGIGISKSEQKNLFQSLSETVTNKDQRQSSSRLGLTLVYDLVRLMGGKIKVSSAPGEGATFSFDVQYTLPEEGEHQSEVPLVTSLKDDAWPTTSPTMAILVAEDHPVNQMVIQELLSKWGHTVEIVENGELAVAAVATCKFDMVIMDIQMPVMDGLQACKEIRKFPGRIKDTPIIALTANSMSGERQRCLKAGMNDYLTKPIHKWELKDTLLTYSNMKRVGEDIWKQKVAAVPTSPNQAQENNLGARTLDSQIFQEFVENFGLEVIKKLSEKLLDQYEVNHSNIMRFLQENDWKNIGREAHMIKSSFGQFGLMQAAAFATQMDTDAKRGNKNNVLDNAISLLNLCDEAIILLKQELEILEPQ